jgi:hypothetical protein
MVIIPIHCITLIMISYTRTEEKYTSSSLALLLADGARLLTCAPEVANAYDVTIKSSSVTDVGARAIPAQADQWERHGWPSRPGSHAHCGRA